MILIQFPDQSSKPHMKCIWLNQTLYYEVLREFGILCQSLIIMRGKNRNIFLRLLPPVRQILLYSITEMFRTLSLNSLAFLTKENCFSFYKASLETFQILKKSFFFKQLEGQMKILSSLLSLLAVDGFRFHPIIRRQYHIVFFCVTLQGNSVFKISLKKNLSEAPS